jgi:hypothetical protein
MSSISRVIAAAMCGLSLAACSMSMPSMDMFKSGPPTEILRIESEPPGADARTSQGQTCRTPCEITVATDAGADLAVTVQMTGYQPQTLPIRTDGSGGAKLQPNPLYVELQPGPPPPKPTKPAPAPKKKTNASAYAAPPTTQTQAAAPSQTSAFPPATGQGYPWPSPTQ